MSSAALAVLKNTFGYDAFRPPQADIITTVIQGGDALVLMPTGGGKSLCYQIPALCRPGVGVVISPLIALMQDQVDALCQVGVRAAYLNSTLSGAEARQVERQVLSNDLDMLYIAPERLTQDSTLDLLDRSQIALFAIDEAHCVSQWGHDFRSDYLLLSLLHQRYANVPRIALTATADERTRGEIVARLDLGNARRFISGFDRPNIRYRIAEKDRANQQLLHFLQREHPSDAGIVYCLSRRKVESVAMWLSEQGFVALPYHAGLSAEERRSNQDRFLKDDGVIIVATIAFGMGIDKPDVRFVAHLDLPKSIEAYYQETGRAGRDGLAANAWMVYGFQDVTKLRQMLEGSVGNESFKKAERYKLDSMLGFCEVSSCRRQSLLGYFGEQNEAHCGNCDNCLEPVKTWDGTDVARKALSTVYRSGQRFGVNHLIDILVGNKNKKIEQFHHQQLSTFGIGSEMDEKKWRSVFRQLVARSYLSVDVEGYGGLRLTEKCRALLRGEEKVMLRADRISDKASPSEASNKYSMNDEEKTLWEQLRETRKQLAQEQGVPPYVIFHDATLMEMVRYQPVELEQFKKVSGVGQTKLERYGEDFLQAIQNHRYALGLDPLNSEHKSEKHAVRDIKAVESSQKQSFALAKSGMTLAKVSQERQLKEDTIARHLGSYLEKGDLSIQALCAMTYTEVEQVYNQLAIGMDDNGVIRLKTVFEFFQGAYSYADLYCLRSAFMSGQVLEKAVEPA